MKSYISSSKKQGVLSNSLFHLSLEIPFLIILRRNAPTARIIYDASNFFTYIDTSNEKAELAKRGHCKSKRNDLHIVGLSLMFSREDGIPLFYETYSGNTNDSRQFASSVKKLKERYRKVFQEEADVTLIFDRGNNSLENIKSLAGPDCAFRYVGGLKKNQCGSLFDIGHSSYEPAHRGELSGLTYYQSELEVFGRRHTVIVTKNPALEKGQLQGLERDMSHCLEKIRELEGRLEKRRTGELKRGKKPTVESVCKNMNKILSAEYMKRLFIYDVKEEDGVPRLTWDYSMEEMEWLREHELGKTVLFTDHHEWESEEIILAYHSAWMIEHTFKQMKDTEHLTVRPLYFWTDQKIKAHIFCCVMAVRLIYLLKKELADHGIETGINEMLESLQRKKQYIHYYQQKRGMRESYSVSMPGEKTEAIMEALGLKVYEKRN